MTVGELKKFLRRCDESAIIVVPKADHMYRVAEISSYFAYDDGRLSEWFEDDSGENGEKVPILIVE
jgi:hypothetical protein